MEKEKIMLESCVEKIEAIFGVVTPFYLTSWQWPPLKQFRCAEYCLDRCSTHTIVVTVNNSLHRCLFMILLGSLWLPPSCQTDAVQLGQACLPGAYPDRWIVRADPSGSRSDKVCGDRNFYKKDENTQKEQMNTTCPEMRSALDRTSVDEIMRHSGYGWSNAQHRSQKDDDDVSRGQSEESMKTMPNKVLAQLRRRDRRCIEEEENDDDDEDEKSDQDKDYDDDGDDSEEGEKDVDCRMTPDVLDSLRREKVLQRKRTAAERGKGQDGKGYQKG